MAEIWSSLAWVPLWAGATCEVVRGLGGDGRGRGGAAGPGARGSVVVRLTKPLLASKRDA